MKEVNDGRSLHRPVAWRALTLLLFGGLALPGFAQDNLAIKNAQDQTVGWLVSKIIGTPFSTYLAADGYLLTLGNNGNVYNTLQSTIDRLLYEEVDCGGPPRVVTSDGANLTGEIIQVGGDQSDLFARIPRGGTASSRLFLSEKILDSECKNLDAPFEISSIAVEERSPLDYALTKSISGVWRVQSPTWEIQRSDLISCDGFESCPLP